MECKRDRLELREETSGENVQTQTSRDQQRVEQSCTDLYENFRRGIRFVEEGEESGPILNREGALVFLTKGLRSLSSNYECLDASRPWLLFWITHSLELLATEEDKDLEIPVEDIIRFLRSCQNPTGGFGGGPGQMSHLAPTYAVISAISIIGIPEAYDIILRKELAEWIDSLRLADGSFLMHVDGEVDMRGVYCAVAVSKMVNIYSEGLFRGTAAWIKSCQTHEGGFGAVPYMEAHGGYSYCAIAALSLMGDISGVKINRLCRWASRRQMIVEGGFQGRTNKLVDGCYSFWQGAIFPILEELLVKDDKKTEDFLSKEWLFNQIGLQKYLLICCQDNRGGLVDKPGKSRDYYHTCYALSGLSISQHCKGDTFIYGSKSNELNSTDVLFNVGVNSATKALKHFENQPVPVIN